VIRRHCSKFAFTDFDRLANSDFLVDHEWIVAVRYLGKIRPDFPVEKVFLENAYRVACAMDDYRLGAHPAYGIDEKRNAGDMIKMRVRNKHMIDLDQLLKRKVADTRTCIEQDVVVDQHCGGAQITANAAAAPEDLNAHLRLLIFGYRR
jgi:hypothetical protein